MPPARCTAAPFREATLLETAVLLRERKAAYELGKHLTGIVALGVSTSLHLINVARHLGSAALRRGDRSEARANYERALHWATKIRFRPEIALTRFELGKLMSAEIGKAGRSHAATALRSQAQDHLDFVVEEFRTMKMKPALEEALHHKRQLNPMKTP